MKKSILFVVIFSLVHFLFYGMVASVLPVEALEELSASMGELSSRRIASEPSASTLFADTFTGWDPVLIDMIGKYIKGEEISTEQRQRYKEELTRMLIISIVLPEGEKHGNPSWTGAKRFKAEGSIWGDDLLNLTARYLMLLEILKAVEAQYPNKETDEPTILSFASGWLLFEYVLVHLLLNYLKYPVVNLHVIDPLYAKGPESVATQTFVTPRTLRLLKRVNMPGFQFVEGAKKSLNLVVWQSAFNLYELNQPPGIFIMIRPFKRSSPMIYSGQKPAIERASSLDTVEEQVFYSTQKVNQRWYVGNGEKRDEGFAAYYRCMTSRPFVRTNLTGASAEAMQNFFNDQKGGEKFAESIRSTNRFIPGLIVQFFELARRFGSRKSTIIAWGPWPAIGRVSKVTNLQRPLYQIVADFYPDDTIYSRNPINGMFEKVKIAQ